MDGPIFGVLRKGMNILYTLFSFFGSSTPSVQHSF